MESHAIHELELMIEVSFFNVMYIQCQTCPSPSGHKMKKVLRTVMRVGLSCAEVYRCLIGRCVWDDLLELLLIGQY